MLKQLPWFVHHKVIQSIFIFIFIFSGSLLSFLKCCLLPYSGNTLLKTSIPVTSLKVGDEILLRVQGGARHTGIEIQEFIVEK